MKELKSRMISGIGWGIASQTGRQLITVVSMIVMARLLSPGEFGLVAMVTAFMGFASLFAEFGFGSAIVQEKNTTDVQLSSIFWINMIIGILLAGIFIAVAPLIARFYAHPELVAITAFVSGNFIINALSIVQRSLLKKKLEFRFLSIAAVVATLVSSFVGIIMAAMGFSYWSLVGQSYALNITINILLWASSDWRPSWQFSWRSTKPLATFGMNVIGNSTLDYWSRNIDKLLIGKYLGSEELGLYSRVFSMMIGRISGFCKNVSSVFFPSMSSIQDDKARVKRAYLRSVGVIAFFVFPLSVGIFVTAENLVWTVLGPKWIESVPILQALCLLALMISAGSLNGALFLSQGQAQLQFRLGLRLKPIVIVGIIIGLQWGVVGVALGYGVAAVIVSYPAISTAGRSVDMRYLEYLNALRGPFVCSLAMGLVVFGASLFFTPNTRPVTLLLIQVGLGAASYYAIARIARISSFEDVLVVLKGKNSGAG